jgi:hypothetical protein
MASSVRHPVGVGPVEEHRWTFRQLEKLQQQAVETVASISRRAESRDQLSNSIDRIS